MNRLPVFFSRMRTIRASKAAMFYRKVTPDHCRLISLLCLALGKPEGHKHFDREAANRSKSSKDEIRARRSLSQIGVPQKVGVALEGVCDFKLDERMK